MAVPGMVKITVSKAGKTLWTLDAVRPASSSGTRGSGVELRLVNYKGKRVLYRGHVPILTVRYDNDACGPYRDWQNEEGAIVAPDGTDIGTTGFRLCNSPAKTMLDTGSDQGDHLGPAIYIDGEDVVIVSEMEAGWYRYISEWRLHSDGTIQPRFGFSAVSNSCVCHAHHHHAYWRLDFDIETAGNNLVEEFDRKLWIPPQPSGTWTPLEYETKRVRFPIFARKWRVRNATTNAAYEIIPGATDGAADSAFGVGDFWAVRYRSDEIDDGVNITRDPNLDAASNASKLLAHIDNFVTGESIENTDVVVWYAAHFTHDFHENEVGHIVGPILKPSNWS
jgi:hypothetical protein